MNLPFLNRLSGGKTARRRSDGSVSLEDHHEESRLAQRRADKWMIVGAALMGMWAPGLIGFPIFMRGVWLQRQALRAGLSVRPMIVTLIGYLVLIDGMLNSLGWALDLVANHTLINRVLMVGWGNMFDAGYFWHYNELWVGGAAGPGEKGYVAGLILTVFAMRVRRGDRLPADEAVGPPVDDHHLLDGRGDLVRLRLQHDDVRRRPLRRRRVPGHRLVALRHLLHHPVPRDPVPAHGQPRNLHRLNRFKEQ